eukprot:scaffold625_cov420-Prasinococcus_capsulatus_cf.AAC.18
MVARHTTYAASLPQDRAAHGQGIHGPWLSRPATMRPISKPFREAAAACRAALQILLPLCSVSQDPSTS